MFDSPVGLAAWIIEKFRPWSAGDPGPVFLKDDLPTNIMLYRICDFPVKDDRQGSPFRVV
jgi:hypothetical protein